MRVLWNDKYQDPSTALKGLPVGCRSSENLQKAMLSQYCKWSLKHFGTQQRCNLSGSQRSGQRYPQTEPLSDTIMLAIIVSHGLSTASIPYRFAQIGLKRGSRMFSVFGITLRLFISSFAVCSSQCVLSTCS